MFSSNPFLQNRTPEKKSSKVLNYFQIFGLLAAVFVLLYFFVITPSEVDGPSMEPTLHHEEILFTNRIMQFLGGKDSFIGDYSQGDIIIFHSEELGKDIVKRVIGVGGDQVRITHGAVEVNDELIVEEYLTEGTPTNGGSFAPEGKKLIVPEGSFFVLGDNRNQSKDSRSTDIGFLKREEIKGKSIVRIWPITAFRFL